MQELSATKSAELYLNTETNIAIKKYRGEISLEDVFDSWLYIIEQNKIPAKTEGVILDYRLASFTLGVNDYKKIISFYSEHQEFFSGLKMAFVSNYPYNIAIAILLARADERFVIRPFTTFKAAIEWLV